MNYTVSFLSLSGARQPHDFGSSHAGRTVVRITHGDALHDLTAGGIVNAFVWTTMMIWGNEASEDVEFRDCRGRMICFTC